MFQNHVGSTRLYQNLNMNLNRREPRMGRVKKKYKKMTAAEKKWHKEFREEMRARGILPPVKPRLNRKKFLQEVQTEFDETIESYTDLIYLRRAINTMIHTETIRNITSEQVGILKVMKIAAAMKNFEQQKLASGETTYNIHEMYEQCIEPIKKL